MSRAVRGITRGLRRAFRGITGAVRSVVGGPLDALFGTNFTGRYDTPDMDIPDPLTSDSGTSFQTGAQTPTTSVGGSSDSKFDTDSIFKVSGGNQAGYQNLFDDSLRKKKRG